MGGGQPCPVCVQMKEVECCLRDACHGCSGEQCGLCLAGARRSCCLGKWMAPHTGKCDGVELPDYASCPKCGGVPCTVCMQQKDVADCFSRSCKGCGGLFFYIHEFGPSISVTALNAACSW